MLQYVSIKNAAKTYIYICTYKYIYICVCVCVCVHSIERRIFIYIFIYYIYIYIYMHPYTEVILNYQKIDIPVSKHLYRCCKRMFKIMKKYLTDDNTILQIKEKLHR